MADPVRDDDLPQVYQHLLDELRQQDLGAMSGRYPATSARAELETRLAWEQLKAARADSEASQALQRSAQAAARGLHIATWVLSAATIVLVVVTILK